MTSDKTRRDDVNYRLFGAWQLWYAGNGVQTNLFPSFDEEGKSGAEMKFSRADYSKMPAGMNSGDDPQPGETPYIELVTSILGVDIDAFPYLRLVCGGNGDMSRGSLFLGATDGWHTVRARRELPFTASEAGNEKGASVKIIDLSALADRLVTGADTTVKLVFRPFAPEGEAADSVSVIYAAFFPTENAAAAFRAENEREYLSAYRPAGDRVRYLEATGEVVGKYTSEAQARITEITNAPSAITPDMIEAAGGSCLYVSSLHGDDRNDGATPDGAIKSMARLEELSERLRAGDAVFFERGSLWRSDRRSNYSGDYCLAMVNGVTYGAYGEGEKPRFYGSLSGKGAGMWEATEYKNVWRFAVRIPNETRDMGVKPGLGDVGNIIFDGGAAWGIKIVPQDAGDWYSAVKPTVDSGMVTNGKESYHSGGKLFTNPGCLEHNLEFFQDYSDESLYLYCDRGNPGEVFDDIEVSARGNLIYGEGRDSSEDNVVDNLCLRYTGSHGFGIMGMKNFTVQNCEIGWIGGSFQGNLGDGHTRFGNAIENYGDCDGFYIRNCYSYQVYDGTMTTQSGEQAEMINIEISDCVLTYGNSPIEIWTNYVILPDGTRRGHIDHMTVRGNYMMYTGYHFGHQRPVKNASFFCFPGGQSAIFSDTVCENNVCILGIGGVTYGSDIYYDRRTGTGPLFRNNVYIMDTDRSAAFETWADPVNFRGEIKQSRNNFYKYDERTIQYYVDATGTEQGSTFYYVRGPRLPEENDGVYRNAKRTF